MKPKILCQLIIVFCIGFSTSCSIVDEDNDYFNGTMQAQINGNLIVFDEVYGDRSLSWETWEWSSINHIIGKTDMNVSGSEIQIDFPFNPVVGKSYHPNCMYRTWIGNYYDYNLTAYLTDRLNEDGTNFSGTLSFSSMTDKSMKGDFSFVAYIVDENLRDSIIVRNGKFEIYSNGKKW